MADRTAISWTDATVNFWWGCTKVGPGCDHCYAETWSKRTGHSVWGAGAPRRKVESAGKLLHRLDNGYADWAADYEVATGNARAFGLPVPTIGRRRRVFIQSMSDLFDLEVPFAWFEEAWRTVEVCNRLEIQIVTKRLPAVEKRLAAIGRTGWPPHAGLIATIVNQPEADRDIPRLIAQKKALGIRWIGLSMEPLLGQVILPPEWLAEIDWIIVGGESGPHARPMHPDWARGIRDACAAAGVPFHFKQWGEWKHGSDFAIDARVVCNDGMTLPFVRSALDLENRKRELATFRPELMRKVGKARSGRELDGVEHDGFPEVRHVA